MPCFRQICGLCVCLCLFGAGLAFSVPAAAQADTLPTAAQADTLPAAAQADSLPAATIFLPEDQAFQLEYGWADKHTLLVGWRIADGYYLYKRQLAAESDSFLTPELPEGQFKHDQFFGDSEVYYRRLQLPLSLQQQAPEQMQLELRWQGCAEAGLCYPPQRRTLQLYRPVADGAGRSASRPQSDGTGRSASLSQSDGAGRIASLPQSEDLRLAGLLGQQALGLSLLLFLALGLGLAFTPCVLPMVPILSGILVGAGSVSKKRSFALSLSYVLAMALTYAAAGAAAAATGASLQSAMQHPLVLLGFSLLMVALALSMFGLYELRLPAAINRWLSRASSQQQGGSMPGAAAMGALSALIVGPCVAPPLIGVLIYIAQSGNVPAGAAALFALGLGMGIPLLVAGVALGSALPKAGGWMQRISQMFGFVLLGLALWFLQRILPVVFASALWALLAAGAALWLLLSLRDRLWPVARIGLAAVLLTWAAMQLLAATGTLRTAWSQFLSPISLPSEHLEFDAEIRSLPELEALFADGAGPVVLDFYADWCVECLEMEARVFPDPQVQQELKRWRLVRVDITDNDRQAKELLQHFSLLGPPTLLFFDADGREYRHLRAVGFVSAERLLQRLQSKSQQTQRLQSKSQRTQRLQSKSQQTQRLQSQ